MKTLPLPSVRPFESYTFDEPLFVIIVSHCRVPRIYIRETCEDAISAARDLSSRPSMPLRAKITVYPTKELYTDLYDIDFEHPIDQSI